jgi:integrase
MPGRKTRSFGSIRKLSSGRWQARYRGPDGLLRSAPQTFAYKADASKWLALALADAIDPRYRALVLLACFCGLRWGELAGLQRADIDCDRGTIRIARQLCEVAGRQPFLAPPKSDAGKRTVRCLP